MEKGLNSHIFTSFAQQKEEGRTNFVLGGTFQHNVDAKNRFFVPAKMRDDLGQTFIVAKSFRDPCLKVYSLSGWDNYLELIRHQNRNLSERAMRFLNESMTQAEPDAQGRIVLPQALIDFAGIKKSALIIGCGDYAEIWNEETYRKASESIDLAAMIAELEALGL